MNESDDTFYISLQKYDLELFSNLVKIDGYLWLSAAKIHSIPLKHKSMLDILAELNRTYEWKSEIQSEKENMLIKLKLKKDKKSKNYYISPPFTQQFDYNDYKREPLKVVKNQLILNVLCI